MRRTPATAIAIALFALLAGCGAAEIPEDWVPFTFDGEEYYLHPLTDSR